MNQYNMVLTKAGVTKMMRGECKDGYIAGNLQIVSRGPVLDWIMRDIESGEDLGCVKNIPNGIIMENFEFRTRIKMPDRTVLETSEEAKVREAREYAEEAHGNAVELVKELAAALKSAKKGIGVELAESAMCGIKVGRDPFWMVWGESMEDFKPYQRLVDLPKVKHDTKEDAITEAKRLAVKHPGKEFHVLKSVSTSSASVAETVFHKEKI